VILLLDADVVVIDKKYLTDVRHKANRAAIDRLKADGHTLVMVAQAVLEAVGVLSLGTAKASIPLIPDAINKAYGTTFIPDPASSSLSDYAQCTFDDLIQQMTQKMALGDAVQAVQIRMFAPHADALLTWNAKHFQGKIVVPVLTPEEWLQQQPPPTVPTP
jgi:hypothetical protein